MVVEPSTEQLELVARHGSGPLERALAIVLLARRNGRERELRELIDAESSRMESDGGTEQLPGETGPGGPGSRGPASGGPAPPPNSSHDEREPSYPDVRNVVTAGSLGREIDIQVVRDDIDVAAFVRGDAEYPSNRLRIRYRSEGPVMFLYRSGSYHITGSRSVGPERAILDRFVGQLQRRGVGRLEVSFGVKNVLAVADLDRPVNLNMLQEQLGYADAEYDPEVDPALMYRPTTVDADFRLYSTGRLLLFAPSLEAVAPSFVWLCQTLGIGS